MIIHSNLSQIKYKILTTCLQGNFRDGLGEFSNTSYGTLGAKRVEPHFKMAPQIPILTPICNKFDVDLSQWSR